MILEQQPSTWLDTAPFYAGVFCVSSCVLLALVKVIKRCFRAKPPPHAADVQNEPAEEVQPAEEKKLRRLIQPCLDFFFKCVSVCRKPAS